MDVYTAVKNRREITRFASTPIPREHLRQLMEIGYLSVTGNNLPSRELILIEDQETLEQLSHATPFMPWLAQAQAGIAIIGNPQESKYWLQDATIATSNIWLGAVSLGIGAAWGAIHHSEDAEECQRREQVVRDVLGIPDHLRPVSVLGFGYAAEQPAPKKHYAPDRVLHRERFDQRIEDLDTI